jgi:hypothetical protein
MRKPSLRPIWPPAILGRAPIWLQSKLSLALISAAGKIELLTEAAASGHSIGLPEKVGKMKIKFAALITLLSLAVSLPVPAKKNPSRLFELRDTVSLNGAEVPPGIYDLTWETHGANTRVTLRKNGVFVATAQGVSVKSGVKYSEDQALLRVNPDGSRSLIEIRIAGAARAIVFNQTDTTVHYSAMKP